MKLLVRRDQKKGLLGGKITFTLDAQAELTPEEQENVKKYKMGKTLLYQKRELVDLGSGMLGLASRLAFKALNTTITVDSLVKGKHLECTDIVEMCALEEHIKEASQLFKEILEAATRFGGEEIVEF